MTTIGQVLDFAGIPERINHPENERFVTVKLNCGGAVERVIGNGKTPVAFTGYRVRSGQFIYSRIDARNGAFAIVPDELDGAVVSKDFPVFSPRLEVVDPSYLEQFFRSGRVQYAIQTMSRGATNRQRISEDVFLGLPLPLPEIADQRRIVAVLSHVDSLRLRRRQVIDLLDALIRSNFAEMFGSETAATTVDQIAERVRTGPFGSQLLHSEFVDDGVAVVGLDNVVGNEFRWAERRFITESKYERLKRYTICPGDVLISIMGTTGRCVVVPDGIPTAITTKHVCTITADRSRLDPIFLRAAFLWHPTSRAHLRRQTKGSIMDGLNMGIIKAMPVPVPSLDRQQRFAAMVDRVAAQHMVAREALASTDALFASLQSQAFRGEL